MKYGKSYVAIIVAVGMLSIINSIRCMQPIDINTIKKRIIVTIDTGDIQMFRMYINELRSAPQDRKEIMNAALTYAEKLLDAKSGELVQCSGGNIKNKTLYMHGMLHFVSAIPAIILGCFTLGKLLPMPCKLASVGSGLYILHQAYKYLKQAEQGYAVELQKEIIVLNLIISQLKSTMTKEN